MDDKQQAINRFSGDPILLFINAVICINFMFLRNLKL